MLIRCIKSFRDLKAKGKPMREVGEVWEVEPSRLAEINRTKYGLMAEAATWEEPQLEFEAQAEGVDYDAIRAALKKHPNKAKLLEIAGSLGIDVPEGSTNPTIYTLIEEALG